MTRSYSFITDDREGVVYWLRRMPMDDHFVLCSGSAGYHNEVNLMIDADVKADKSLGKAKGVDAEAKARWVFKRMMEGI